MPTIKILTSMAGAYENWVAGQTYDFDDETATRLCAGPNAELVEGGQASAAGRSTRTSKPSGTRRSRKE